MPIHPSLHSPAEWERRTVVGREEGGCPFGKSACAGGGGGNKMENEKIINEVAIERREEKERKRDMILQRERERECVCV